MSTVIGDEDNGGWTSATMTNGKMVEQDPKFAADSFNVPKPVLDELNANYPYPLKHHKCSEGGCAIPDYLLVDADTPDAKLVPRYEDGTLGPPNVTTGCSQDYPKWAPTVDRADPIHSGLMYGPTPTLDHKEAQALLDAANKLRDSLTKRSDPINPQHYTSHPSGVDCITISEHFSFCLGNVIKYTWRAGLKYRDILEDLKKARWYLDREISRLETPNE